MQSGNIVAVVGATGAVGREMVRILADRNFPLAELRLFSTARSAGARLAYGLDEREVVALEDPERQLRGVRFALMSAGAAASRALAPRIAAAGAVVIDNSSAWRMEPDVPLVVPEVNASEARARPRGIIANPNCSTIQLVLALKPLHDAAGLRRVVVSTYQAISGAGARALAELRGQVRAVAAGGVPVAEVLPYPIYGNLLFHDIARDGGDSEEEIKIVRETRRILGLPELAVTATCVRVPVEVAHSEAVWVELERPLTVARARALLSDAPGVELSDDAPARIYPRPRDAAGQDPVYVGRVRADPTVPHGLAFWVVADNLRKGAALNAVQIAEWIAAMTPHP